MLRALAAFGILSAVLAAAENPIKEISARAIIDRRMPSFRNGYLYVVDPNHIVTIFGPDGNQLTPIVITGKGHGHVSIQAVGVDTDGTLAISWSDSPDAGIDFRDRYGNLLRTMDTGTFIASDLGFGEGHTLWAVGYQRDAVKPDREETKDYATVRKYSADGSALGAYLPKSMFAEGLPPGGQKPVRGITIAHDRVGVELFSGHVSTEQEWVELDLDGNLKGRWKLERMSSGQGVAFTSDGQAYVERFDRSTKTRSVLRLNHGTGAWEQVTSPGGYLYGAEGTSLVYGRWPDAVMHLSWYAQPQAVVTTASK